VVSGPHRIARRDARIVSPMPTHHARPAHHPYAAVLRQRAARLQHLARQIDVALVHTLDPEVVTIPADTARARLCERLLDRNLHQLHRAADDLRSTAFRFLARADEFDRHHGAVA
jgi:hypothetical protein